MVRKQKTDSRDALYILDLLSAGSFSADLDSIACGA
jgi:hypothetical protein